MKTQIKNIEIVNDKNLNNDKEYEELELEEYYNIQKTEENEDK